MINIDKQWLSIARQKYLPLKMVRVLLENVHLIFFTTPLFPFLAWKIHLS